MPGGGGGPGACSPENNDKNGAIWCSLGVPKYVITNLNINNFKYNKTTTKELNWQIFLSDKSRCAC